jgi:hypothetical protein
VNDEDFLEKGGYPAPIWGSRYSSTYRNAVTINDESASPDQPEYNRDVYAYLDSNHGSLGDCALEILSVFMLAFTSHIESVNTAKVLYVPPVEKSHIGERQVSVARHPEIEALLRPLINTCSGLFHTEEETRAFLLAPFPYYGLLN